MNEKIRQFFNYIQYEKRLSNHTVLAYTNDINQFQIYLKAEFQIDNILETQFQMLRSWIVHLIDLQDSVSTINRKISCLKSFFKFCLKNNWVAVNPTAKLTRPKMPKRIPKQVEFTKLMDLKDFLQEQSSDNQYDTYRDYSMFMTFYSCGLRRSELIELKWSDIDFTKKELKILGKGNKERFVPLHSEMAVILKRYQELLLQQSFEKKAEPALVFLTDSGEKMYPNFVYRKIKTYLNKVTTQTGLSPHSLRHSFATHLLNEGAELNAVKELLGHSSLAATQVYTSSSIERLKKIHEKFHPKL
jgi:integrase/recombinase XerC